MVAQAPAAWAQAKAPAHLVDFGQGEILGEVGAIFSHAFMNVQAAFSVKLVGVQLLAILTVLALAWLVSRPLKAFLYNALDQAGERLKRLSFVTSAVRLISRLSFPIIGLLFLGLARWSLNEMGYFNPKETLYFFNLAEFVLWAYAALKILIKIVRGAFGRDRVSVGLERFLITSFWVLVVLQIVGILPALVAFMRAVEVPLLGEGTTLWSIAQALFSVLIALMLAGWLIHWYTDWINEKETLHPNIRLVLIRLGTIVLVTVAVLIGLDAVGFNLAVLSVFGGALGVGIGFGMQKIASNYISGFIILLDRSIKLGDVIRVNNFEGTVSEINTRYTVIRNRQGVESIVPNENLVTDVVENLSYSDRLVRGTTMVSVGYSSDIKLAIQILLEIAAKHPRIANSGTNTNYAWVKDFGADGIDIELGYWIKDPENGTIAIRSDLNQEILRRFNEAGIEIPFAQREITLKGEPTIKVVMDKN